MQKLVKTRGNVIVSIKVISPRTDLVHILKKECVSQGLVFDPGKILMNIPGAGIRIGKYEYIIKEIADA